MRRNPEQTVQVKAKTLLQLQEDSRRLKAVELNNTRLEEQMHNLHAANIQLQAQVRELQRQLDGS